jgi:hypothetical protein
VGGEPGVCLDDLDVRQPLFGHQLPRHGDVDRVDLESYDAAPGADALGEQLEESTRAASDVDRALSLGGADSVQQLGGQGWSSVVCLRNRSASAVSRTSAYVTGVGESDAPGRSSTLMLGLPWTSNSLHTVSR